MRRALIIVVLALAAIALAQQQQQQEQLPDAPSANLPTNNPLEGAPPAPKAKPQPAEATPDAAAENPAGTPSPEVKTVPPGTVLPGDVNSRDQLFKLVTVVNQVVVPVTVKDPSGHLVEGLQPDDFQVLENGVVQKINFFTSDPFPLSASVVIDSSLNDLTLRKVNATMPALLGAFSQYDEVSVYQYGDTVEKVADFQSIGPKLSNAMKAARRKGTYGVPVTSGPMASGPVINGRPFDPGQMHVSTPRRESHVLNDAILKAALDLSQRDKARRRILFVISDGREDGSNVSYGDVLKVLLSHNITLYAIGVDSAAIPGYRRAQQTSAPHLSGIGRKGPIPIPEFQWYGYGNLLPKYASATGGQVFSEFSQQAIETAYARATEVARNQYTLGYLAKSTPTSDYRSIEVRVDRPDLRVFARDGYFPLPPGRQ
jgi:VWFA-related protein